MSLLNNVQTSCHSSPSFSSPTIHYFWSFTGTLDVNCMYPDRLQSPSLLHLQRRDNEAVSTFPVDPPDPRPAKLVRQCLLSARQQQARCGDDLYYVSHVLVVGAPAVGPAS
jgi:hypothetical protein